jgi:IPT/TIG domain
LRLAPSFNGVPKATTRNGPQNVFATISTADIGAASTVQVTVSNPSPGGGPSAPQSFVITQPTVVPNITSLNPATVPAGIPTSLTINGTGFTQGAALDVVGTGGGYYNTTFISSTQISIPSFAVGGVGTFPIYVVDPAPAGTSTAFNLTVTQPPPPTITSISPTTAQTGSVFTLTINGTNFQHGASVMFNGGSFGTNFTSSTQLTVFISLGGIPAGTYPLSVVNPIPAPTTSAPVNFIVTGPPDFSITSSGATTQTVAAGQTATFTNAISVTAQSGFSSPVNLSCSPPLAVAATTTCAVNPSMFASGSGTATVTVTTMARGFVPPAWPRVRFIFRPQYLPGVLLTLLFSALLLRLARTRRQRFAGALPLAGLLLFMMLQAIGCGGGGGSSGPPPPTGTPVGTYTVTATATSGSLTHTTTLTLVVQ